MNAVDTFVSFRQEALLHAWQGLAGYQARAPLAHWLLRITTTTCLKMIRTRSRRPATTAEIPYLQPYPDRLLDQLSESDGDPATIIAHSCSDVTLAAEAAAPPLPAEGEAGVVVGLEECVVGEFVVSVGPQAAVRITDAAKTAMVTDLMRPMINRGR